MIDNEFMLQLIEDYLKKHSGKSFPTKEKTALRKLLLDRGDSFFARWKDPKNKNDIGLCIRMTLTSDPGDKTESLRRMKNFASFLQQPKSRIISTQ